MRKNHWKSKLLTMLIVSVSLFMSNMGYGSSDEAKISLTSTGVVSGYAEAEYENGALKVKLEYVPAGIYDLYINGVFQGSGGTYLDDDGYYEAKLYVVENPSEALIEVKQGEQTLFAGTFPGNTTGGITPTHIPTPKMYLSNTGVVGGSAEAEYEDEHGSMVLKVEIEHVPDGSYDLYIEGSFKATMTTYLHDGYYKARVALVNINPVGAFIEIKEGSQLLFYGTFPDGSTSPTGFSAKASGSIVTIDCNAVSGANGYNLHYGYSSGNYIDTLDLGNETSHVFANVPSATYYLALTSYDSSGESAYSKEVVVTTGTNPPGKINTPTDFRAAVSGNTVTISWNAVSDATGYKLYYGNTSSGNYMGSADLGNTTSNVFIQVPTGTYYLALTAYNSSGESMYSNEITFTITETLNPPTGFTATVNGSTVSLTWDKVNGATGYMLYYGITTSRNYMGSVDLGNKTSNVFILVPSGTYYLALTSYSNSQESLYSNEVIFTVP